VLFLPRSPQSVAEASRAHVTDEFEKFFFSPKGAGEVGAAVISLWASFPVVAVFGWSDWINLFKVVGGIIAVATFVKATYEFTRRAKEKRAEQFLALRRRVREDQNYGKILDLLYSRDAEADSELRKLPLRQRVDFMAFFEDAAFLAYSGLVRKEVILYMFGGDARTAWYRDAFWSEEERRQKHWALLKDFVEEEGSSRYCRKSMRL
jgi:hypothetical protein